MLVSFQIAPFDLIIFSLPKTPFFKIMLLKEPLETKGFPLLSDNKVHIFHGQTYKMLIREKEYKMHIAHDMDKEELIKDWNARFSAQHTETFVHTQC